MLEFEPDYDPVAVRDGLQALEVIHSVPASLIFSIADIFEDPQYRARGNIQMTDSRAGEIAVPGVVPRLSVTPGEIRWLGAGLGAQNEEIFGQLLQLSSAEISDLRTSGVI